MSRLLKVTQRRGGGGGGPPAAECTHPPPPPGGETHLVKGQQPAEVLLSSTQAGKHSTRWKEKKKKMKKKKTKTKKYKQNMLKTVRRNIN